MFPTFLCYKVFLAFFPLLARNVPAWWFRVVMGCMWLLSASNQIIQILAPSNIIIFFDQYSLICRDSSTTHPVCENTLTIIFVWIPLIILITTNIILLYVVTKYNPKGRKLPNRAALITVTMLCWGFLITYVPWIIWILLVTTSTAPTWLKMFANNCFSLNYFLNPCIYTLTNKRFRDFVTRKYRRKVTDIRETIINFQSKRKLMLPRHNTSKRNQCSPR